MTTYTEDQLTGWFYVEVQKPWEPGVYLVKSNQNKFVAGCYWHGDRWGNAALLDDENQAIQAASRWKDHLIGSWESEIKQWRGLNHNPSAPPKLKSKGNKRKTMYVVVSLWTSHPQAAFNDVDNARNYAEQVDYPVRIRRIRFRTPEHN